MPESKFSTKTLFSFTRIIKVWLDLNMKLTNTPKTIRLAVNIMISTISFDFTFKSENCVINLPILKCLDFGLLKKLQCI